MSDFRMKRVNEQVKRELSLLIRERMPVEDHGVISVTGVDVSKDLRTANVYVSIVGVANQEERAIHDLAKIRGGLQHDLARKVIMKYTPHLVFKHDRGLERGQHVTHLLDELDQQSGTRHQKASE